MFTVTGNVYSYPSPINKCSPMTCNAFIWISNYHPTLYPVQLVEKLSETLTHNLYTHFKQYFHQLAGHITHCSEIQHEETKYVSLTMCYVIKYFHIYCENSLL